MTDNTASLRVDGATLRLVGELRFETVAAILAQLTTAIAATPAAAVLSADLSDVSRVDSAGLALLLEAVGIAERSGRSLRLINEPASLQKLARISEVDWLLFAGGRRSDLAAAP